MTTPIIAETAPSQPSPRVTTLTLTPTFKLVFLSVVGITVLAMVLSCYLLSGPKSEERTALMNAFLTTWKLGFGAIIGLLGGKAM